ncbi:hypothetical protein KI688_010780 [Linnemannia hyalina]|uniref:Uncharacterized protein n=1 Tax=Linnemannia hyalina TaxID=64524 RepID=A0A9P7XWP9_9FUNG|nr:hypothetical protein KI688_010780 [Linnemannia hyalina]
MIMTTTTTIPAASAPPSNSPLHNSNNKSSPSPPRAASPVSSDSVTGRHLIYRGIKKKSMEYMSIAHSSQHPCLVHTLKGEILISGLDQPGYIQYCFGFDKDWMTRRVTLTAMFDGGSEKRLTLEVDRNQRWYKVTEHRLLRSRSFFRSGVASAAPGADHHQRQHTDGMQDVDAAFSDAASCCSASPLSPSATASDQDVACSIPFEKINLTWTPPPKGSKRASKRFSSFNPLKDALSPTESTFPTNLPLRAMPSGGTSCATTPTANSTTTTITSPLSPPSLSRFAKANPDMFSGSSPASGGGRGTTTYEHLPWLDGCIDLDLGSDFSPSTLLPSLRRATLGIDPDKVDAHLEGLIANPSAITSERMVVVSFPDLELRPLWTHVAYVGKGEDGLSVVEVWTDEDDDDKDGTLVEVDSDGLVVRYGGSFGRIPLEA